MNGICKPGHVPQDRVIALFRNDLKCPSLGEERSRDRWRDQRASAAGKTMRQIVFAGERFDAVSVQNWRKKVLGGMASG
jgi:hypothetical protein